MVRDGGASPRIAVIVTALPERRRMLEEALAGVAAQTRAPAFVVVGVNHSPDRVDGATHANRLVEAVDEEWLAFLHDDDVWLPEHLEGLAAASDDADIVVADFDVEGRDWDPGHHCDYSLLRSRNWFGPSVVMIRSEVFHAVGGWPQKAGEIWGDWGMWLALLERGARFRCSHRKTVRYRFHGDNMTFEAGSPVLPLKARLEQDGWPEGYSDDGWVGPRLSLGLRLTDPAEALSIKGCRPEGSQRPEIMMASLDGEPLAYWLRFNGSLFELIAPLRRKVGEQFRLRLDSDVDFPSMVSRSVGDRRELSFQLLQVAATPAPPMPVLGSGLERAFWSEGFFDDGWASSSLRLGLQLAMPADTVVIHGWQPDGSSAPNVLGMRFNGVAVAPQVAQDGNTFEVMASLAPDTAGPLVIEMETVPNPVGMAGRGEADHRELSFQLVQVRALKGIHDSC